MGGPVKRRVDPLSNPSSGDSEPLGHVGHGLAGAGPCLADGVTNCHKVHVQRWAASAPAVGSDWGVNCCRHVLFFLARRNLSQKRRHLIHVDQFSFSWRTGERNYCRYIEMPGVQHGAKHRDAYRLLPVLLRMQPLSRCVEAAAGRLLRVLLLRRCQMSLDAGYLADLRIVPIFGMPLERGRLCLQSPPRLFAANRPIAGRPATGPGPAGHLPIA